MDAEELRQYIVRVQQALDRDGCYEEDGIVITRTSCGWAVRLRLGWVTLPDRNCAIRAFICGLEQR